MSYERGIPEGGGFNAFLSQQPERLKVQCAHFLLQSCNALVVTWMGDINGMCTGANPHWSWKEIVYHWDARTTTAAISLYIHVHARSHIHSSSLCGPATPTHLRTSLHVASALCAPQAHACPSARGVDGMIPSRTRLGRPLITGLASMMRCARACSSSRMRRRNVCWRRSNVGWGEACAELERETAPGVPVDAVRRTGPHAAAASEVTGQLF